jgi:curli biogenesis system outer membrane secretion channel CsgG
MSRATLGESAADQFAELLAKTRRFDVIKRDEFTSMLSQQALGDMVRPGMVTRGAPVNGVDYILVGSITNLSITKTADPTGWWDTVKDTVTRAPDKAQVKVTANCGVEFKLVDPATGDWQVPSASEFRKEAGADEFGIDISASAGATQPGASIPVTRDDRERIIRLALDDAIRKNLAKIDRFVASRPEAKQKPAETVTQAPAPRSTSTPATAVSPTVPPSPAPAAAKVACPSCGAENDPAATFCRRCGTRLK